MTTQAIALLVAFLVVLLVLAYPLGRYLALVGEGGAMRGLGWLHRIEQLFYRIAGTSADAAMGWKRYAVALLVFNTVGALFVYALQRLQAWLPLNPAGHCRNVGPDSSFNTAVSFVTNTNWQGYGGESTMSYLTQMLALTVQNFLSAATGMAVVFALIRGFARTLAASRSATSGSTSPASTLYVLLPLSARVRGVPDGAGRDPELLAPTRTVTLLEPVTYSQPKNGAGRPAAEGRSRQPGNGRP